MHRQTGDQGQRFLVRAFGYPKADQANDIGYCNEQKSASMMLKGIEMAPSATSVWIIDRQEQKLMEWSGDPEDHISVSSDDEPSCTCLMCETRRDYDPDQRSSSQ